VAVSELDLEPFLEDVFVRWSDVAARNWMLGAVAPGTLMADPHALRIALDALVDNAVAHTTVSNTIELSAHVRGRSIDICVRDDGPGIPPEALGRIFERFGRADRSRSRQHGGVGLGLSIVDAIARGHHGKCTVVNPGQGVMFCLTLPGFSRAQPATPVKAAGDALVHMPLA
jgi:signal transduction histidine kinase